MKKIILLILLSVLVNANSYNINLVQGNTAEYESDLNEWTLESGDGTFKRGYYDWIDDDSPDAGTFYFYSDHNNTLSQNIDLSQLAEDIDGGSVEYNLSGYHRGAGNHWMTHEPQGIEVKVEFLDANNTLISDYSTGLYTTKSMTYFEHNSTIPSGTRSAKIYLIFQGIWAVGYCDNISFILPKKIDNPPPPDTSGLMGCYYNNTDWSGAPLLTRVDKSINFDWGNGWTHGLGSPDPTLFGFDNFSAKWVGKLKVTEDATYLFSLKHDDGVQIFIDGDLIYKFDGSTVDDHWQSRTFYSSPVTLTAGNHDIIITFFDNVYEANIKVSWQNDKSISNPIVIPESNLVTTGLSSECDTPIPIDSSSSSVTTQGPFDAWDDFRSPNQRNISTKIAGRGGYYKVYIGTYGNTYKTHYSSNSFYNRIFVRAYDEETKEIVGTGFNDRDSDGNIIGVYIPSNPDGTKKFLSEKTPIFGKGSKRAYIGFTMCATHTEDEGFIIWRSNECTDSSESNPSLCKTITDKIHPKWILCTSSDRFAIRPYEFKIDTNNTIVFKAGEAYPIDYKALNYHSPNNPADPTWLYNESDSNKSRSSFEIKTEINIDNPDGCVNRELEKKSTIHFDNGYHHGDIYPTIFNTVGDFNITIQEIEGREFASIDRSDPPVFSGTPGYEDIPIPTSEPFTLHIVPASFEINAIVTNANQNNNFTYLNDISGDKSMGATLSLNIQAVDADGNPTENYESDCFADDTNLLVEYNLTDISPIGSLTKILYYDDAGNTEPKDTPLSNNRFSLSNNKTIFKIDSNGSAHLTLKINFDRKNNSPVNPFKVKVNDINLSEDDNETFGDLNLTNTDNTTTFLFGRAKPSKEFYDDVTEDSIKTPISILVYCDKWLACKDFGIAQTSDFEWWLSTQHNSALGDGNITLSQPSNYSSINKINISTSQAVDDTIVVNRGNPASLPYSVDIQLDTSHTSPWLIYNKNDALLPPNPFYRVRFIDKSKWAGEGGTGYVVDSNASSQKTKRLEW